MSETLSERKQSNKQVIVHKFVDTASFSNPRRDWPREMKICSKLVEMYGEPFLLYFDPARKMTSLAYYISDYGKKDLSQQFAHFKRINTDLTKKVETVTLSDTKIGEDLVIEKPKTMKDFLTMFSKQPA